MSYPRDLDEIPTDELTREVARRRHLRSLRLCDYCGRSYTDPACKYPERHRAQYVCVDGIVIPADEVTTLCKGCSYTKRACDQAKTKGALKCCPDCRHDGN